jgi:L-lysine 6-transaminase
MLEKGYPLVFDHRKSHNSYIYDSLTNKEYLDMFSFYGSWPISHNHPKLNTPEFKQQLGELAIHNPSNADIYTTEMAQFVATFDRVCMPPEFNHLFLISTGTHAVENALKTAFDWKVRKNLLVGKPPKGHQVIHFREAFHGRSGYSLSLTNTDPAKYLHFPLFKWPRITNPKINNGDIIQQEAKAVNQIMHAIESNPDDIACIILEPIQGEGGDNHFRPEFWQTLREIADSHELLLIADEVQSGLGLTGKMWAHEHLGPRPDIICFGKKAQVCGIICTNRIDEIKDNVFKVPSRINSTWGGNLIDMMRSRRILEIIEEDKLVQNARVVGDYTKQNLYHLQAKYPNHISNVRGKGLMCAFDLPNKEMCRKLINSAYDRQLIIIGCGEKSIRLRPMLDVKKTEIDSLLYILDKCFINITKKT